MPCTATKAEVSQPTEMWMSKLLTPPRSAVQSKISTVDWAPISKVECQWCNLVEDIHNFWLATFVSMARYLLSGLSNEILWPAQYKRKYILDQTPIANSVAMVTCSSSCGGTLSRSSNVVGSYLYPMLVWVCVYEHAHLRLCWLAIVLNYQIPCVIGQTSMEGVHYHYQSGHNPPCQSECFKFSVHFFFGSEVLTLQI